jgi:hypothetical protein
VAAIAVYTQTTSTRRKYLDTKNLKVLLLILLKFSSSKFKINNYHAKVLTMPSFVKSVTVILFLVSVPVLSDRCV